MYYDDPEARAQLIDALVKDARAALVALDGRELSAAVSEAARVLAAVVGQDLDEDDQGTFKIARRVAKDRIISTVDTDARHGHKTQSRSFDGYKAHVSIDPDSELVTATAVTACNVADGEVAEELLAGDLDSGPGTEGDAEAGSSEPAGRLGESERLAVYGDSAYGAGTGAGRARAGRRADHVQDPRRPRRRAAGLPRTTSTSTSTAAR